MAGNIESGGWKNPLDLNKASKEDLKQIKGISDTLADKIVSYRSEHGGFKSLDELDQVPGFSETRKDEIRGAVTLGGKSTK
jgi:competence protein ComEA